MWSKIRKRRVREEEEEEGEWDEWRSRGRGIRGMEEGGVDERE